MSFACRPNISTGSIKSPFTAWVVSYTSNIGNLATATFNWKSDGSVTQTGSGDTSIDVIPGTDRWFDPVGGSPGTAYWIRATLTSGVNPTTGTMSTWLQLNSDRTWQNSATTNKNSIMTFEIATDSGGSNIVFTSTSNQVVINHAPP